jgi:4-methylaminobutanoate oxidase (formaldehyde-forming)
LGNEPVAVEGEVVGRVTSGGYGYTVGASIAYAYVPVAYADPGTAIAVDVFGTWVGGRVTAEPLYDPASERVKGVQTGAATTPTMT